MDNLQINLFGATELRFNNKYLFVFPTRKCEAILVYLILAQGKRIQREVIASEFWQRLSGPCGRRALNSDVWRLRKLLRQLGLEPQSVLAITTETLAFDPSIRCSVDVFEFEQQLCRLDDLDPLTVSLNQVKTIENALGLYRGDVFEACYDDWCESNREAMRARRFKALEFLMQYNLHHQGFSNALHLARQMLTLDPLMEHIHRAIMCCHYLMGNRPAAVTHYSNCARLLQKELGIDPMPETRQLYQMIVRGTDRIDLDIHTISVRPQHQQWPDTPSISTFAKGNSH